MANVHPWFANVSADDSAAWTATFFQQNDVELAGPLANNATMYITETGWPTVSYIRRYSIFNTLNSLTSIEIL